MDTEFLIWTYNKFIESNINKAKLEIKQNNAGFVVDNFCKHTISSILLHCLENNVIFNEKQQNHIVNYINVLNYER